MGHTRSTQQRSYNLMSSSEKTVSAHNDLQDWTSVMTMDLNVAIANNMQQVVPSRASQPPQSLVTLFNSPANVGSNSMGPFQMDATLPLYEVQKLLKRQLSPQFQKTTKTHKKNAANLFEVLVDWKPTWEPLGNLSIGHQQQALKIKIGNQDQLERAQLKKKARSL
jgi:hypothetical protein